MASDGAADDNFGRAVAATDSMVVVGAHGNDDRGSESGSAYVFEKNRTGQYEQASKLVPIDGAAGDYFGWSVAASGSMVVVGAYGNDDLGSESGSVYVFEKISAGQYDQASKLVPSDSAAGSFFGWSVAATTCSHGGGRSVWR